MKRNKKELTFSKRINFLSSLLVSQMNLINNRKVDSGKKSLNFSKTTNEVINDLVDNCCHPGLKSQQTVKHTTQQKKNSTKLNIDRVSVKRGLMF